MNQPQISPQVNSQTPLAIQQNRRQFSVSTMAIAGAALGMGTLDLNTAPLQASTTKENLRMMPNNPPRYCLNTSTIQGDKIPIIEQLEIAQKAGYDGIEIWLRDVDKFVGAGGTVQELRERIEDSGLTIEGAIAFAEWIIDDDERRAKGLLQARKEMELVVALGGKRIAAPPAGATNGDKLNLDKAAERYRALLEVGAEVGCLPMLEVWGFSSNLHKLSEVLYVAAGSLHPDACVLPDVYHLYKGGSDFTELPFLSGTKVPMLHMNDYPEMARDKITDADRVYPGEGVAPVVEFLRTLYASGFNGTLSLELFNRSYWAQDPLEVAKTGLSKMKDVVQQLG